MSFKKCIFAILPVIFATNAVAETTTEEDKKNWEAKVQFGAIFTSGNTETTSIIGKAEYKHETDLFINKLEISGLYKEDELELDNGEKDKQSTAERYYFSGQSDYKFGSEDTTLYVFGAHTTDKFGGIEKHNTISAGFSHYFFKEEDTFFKTEIGPGYVWGEEQDGTDIDSGTLRGAMDYEWKINEYVTFTQKLSVESSFEAEKNTRTHSVTGFSSKVGDSLQVKLAIAVTNNTEVPMDTEETDVATLLTLVYDI